MRSDPSLRARVAEEAFGLTLAELDAGAARALGRSHALAPSGDATPVRFYLRGHS